MNRQNYLSNLSEFEGMSLRAIAKKTEHHFNTVKKYVDKEDWNRSYKVRKKRGSLLEPLYPIIDEWIEEDLKRKRKHRRTGTKIYNDLKAHKEHGKKLAVGIQTVVAYVSRRKKELSSQHQSTAMYGLHPPCYAQKLF